MSNKLTTYLNLLLLYQLVKCRAFSSPNLCDQVREHFSPCIQSSLGAYPTPATPECCSAIRGMTHDDACACTVTTSVQWRDLASKLLVGRDGIPNWPAIFFIPFQCGIPASKIKFRC